MRFVCQVRAGDDVILVSVSSERFLVNIMSFLKMIAFINCDASFVMLLAC